MGQNFSKLKDESTPPTNNGIDRISNLPEVIIHHILSFLRTKEAARTSILSKSWLQIWSTQPFLDFDQTYFGLIPYQKINDACMEDNLLMFLNEYSRRKVPEDNLVMLINDTLEGYSRRGVPIQKFRLHINTIIHHKLVHLMKSWLRTVQQNGVGELDLDMTWERSVLPTEIFEAVSLQVLKATSKSFRCKLFLGPNDIKCRNLKKLELEGIAIDAATYCNITCKCPLIEELSLINFGWSQVHVNNLPRLRALRLECLAVEWVKVDAPKLQSLICRGMGVLHIGVTENLKVLYVSSAPVMDEQLRNILSANPCIEDLTLFNCLKLERINLSSPFLKHLSLSRCGNLVEVVVDAPNLQFLDWHHLPRSTLPITSPTANGECKVSIYCGGEICGSWFEELRDFLTKFQKSEVKISQYSDIKFESVGFRAIPLPSEHEIKNLTLCYEQSISRAHLDALLCMCHPKVVLCEYADTIFNNALMITFCMELRNRRNPKCCNLEPNKCWRHYIKDSVFQFEVDDSRWIRKQRASFALEWKDYD